MLLEVSDLRHVYQLEDPVVALDGINAEIESGEFIGLVGHTGSGKSTLAQTLNGLIEPTEGTVYYREQDIFGDEISLREIRKKVGLVFQYPEHQLFEETVAEDISFGPKNLGLEGETIEERVRQSLDLVGLDYDEFRDRSPFNLSGGQQRRVAIAGVLALKPEVLILDEPSAALDPEGRKKLLDLLADLHGNMGLTIILITHRMEQVARLADRVLVMKNGGLVLDGTPEEVFTRQEYLREMALDLPPLTRILQQLNDRGLPVRTDIFETEEAAREIESALDGESLSRERGLC